MSETLGSMLRETARSFPQKPAIIYEGETTSYGRLDTMSDAIAAYLHRQGVELGDRVGLYCINSPEFIASYYGIAKVGAVVVPINLLLGSEEVAYILADAGVRGLIYHDAYAKTAHTVSESVPTLRVRIVVGKRSVDGEVTLADVLSESATTFESPTINAGNLASVMYTSGTTGKPKGAMLTHGNLIANASAIRDAMKVTSDDVFLVVLPMFHSFAATVGTHLPVMTGATISAMLRFIPDDVGKTIEETKATVFLGVPSMYTVLANLPEGRRADLSSLRIAVSGG
ncbi:MAG TPA: long-chain fatty acid--CoA ligase, partial [Firmicutes bacterium]|nr:long-chain fatty acid--CoA ligase [Bacillota bacterium]